MIRCFALVLLLVGGIAAEAQAQRIEGAEVVGYGLFEATNKQEVIDPNISSGKRINYEQSHIVKSTSTIPVAGENVVVFGAAIKLRGSPRGQATAVSVVWLYPGRGLTNPSTGNTKTKDEFQTEHKFGETRNYFWTINASWSRVPGTWTLQIWQGERLLAQQFFDLVN